MSKYLLKITGSDEIINIVKWNGVGELTAPEGHYYTPFVTESIDFIEYVPTSSIDEINYFGGSLFGTFEGELTGSININGRTLDTILYETRYGSITFLSGSNGTAVSASKGITVSGSQLILALDNLEDGKQYNYSSSLDTIVQNPTKNYVLKLKNVSNNNDQLEYVISNATIETDGESNYLNAIIKYTHNTFFDEFHTLAEGSTFYVDFDLGDEAYSGKFYGEHTGSFTGSFEGDAELTGSFFGIFKGLLDGTASNSAFSQTASFAQTASRIDVIQKSTNWTKPSWAKTIRVTCVGGGGGGGAAPALEDTMSLTTGGGGGGGGTITTGEFDARTLSDVISITVGAGGFGGIHDGTNLIGPSVGGDTYFGRYLIARGGNQGSNGMVGGVTVVRGGSSIANINYLNTGAGGGGAGTINGIMELSTGVILDASKAPPLPLPRTPYLSVGEIGSSYYTIFPTPVPAVIAPTGGGGGLGYDDDNGGRQDGITNGGKISPYQLTSQENKFASLTPTEYGSGSYEIVDSESIDLGRYPAYNTTIGLGGRGGNPYYIDIDLSSAMPTDGTMYGGGGGGAFGGGIIGRYTNGEVNGTPYNFGANGAQGVVVIISEA